VWFFVFVCVHMMLFYCMWYDVCACVVLLYVFVVRVLGCHDITLYIYIYICIHIYVCIYIYIYMYWLYDVTMYVDNQILVCIHKHV